MGLGSATLMRTKFFLILYTGVARGPLLWCRGDVPGKSQEQQQLVAVQHNPFLYPMKSINKHHWEPEIWLPQLHFLFWLLAHGSDRAALWLGPYGRFLRAKIFSVIGSLRKEAAEVRMQWRNWMQKKEKNGTMQRWGVGSGCPSAVPVHWNRHLVDRQLRKGDGCILL